MKTIYSKFNKQRINDLPRALFPGRIVVVQSEAEAERAAEILSKADIIGLDTETKPNFQARRQNKVALLQVSTHEICFLFRLNMIGFPDCVKKLLTDENLLKVGLSLPDDFRQLCHLSQFVPAGYIELQDFVKGFGVQDLSLQKLYANIMGGRISKGQQLSNWEADTLNPAQQGYAATDAWACIMLYEELMKLREEGFHVLYEPGEVAEPKIVVPKEKKTSSRKKKNEQVDAPTDEEIPIQSVPEVVEPAQEEPAADAQVDESVATESNEGQPAEAQPKRRKSKRRKKPAATSEPSALTAEQPKADESVQPAAKPKKKRRKPAKKQEPLPASPIQAEESEKPSKPKRRKPARKPSNRKMLDETAFIDTTPEAKSEGGFIKKLMKKIIG